ncbi:MAG TPA: SoxR reducing system RseC family protein [Dissulfurispiraceae bacterium]|nr:SoxR reducing system RseC family protein [Dissulfurispiraceae bacterium]
MEETGIVKDIRGDKAIVLVQKQSACGSCAAGGSCTAGENSVELEAINQADAEIGDHVKIAFTAYTYLKGALIFYGIPAAALVVGAVVGKDYLSRLFPGADPDSLSGIAGVTLFVLSFIVVRLVMKQFEKKRQTTPVVVEVLRSRQNPPV